MRLPNHPLPMGSNKKSPQLVARGEGGMKSIKPRDFSLTLAPDNYPNRSVPKLRWEEYLLRISHIICEGPLPHSRRPTFAPIPHNRLILKEKPDRSVRRRVSIRPVARADNAAFRSIAHRPGLRLQGLIVSKTLA